MIKGVTKNVIEIRSRENGYIEKIIVFLKDAPEFISDEENCKQTFMMIGK